MGERLGGPADGCEKQKNHHFKVQLRLLSRQLGVSSGHRGTRVLGDAVGDAGVVPNGRDLPRASVSWHVWMDSRQLLASVRGLCSARRAFTPRQIPCCHLRECVPLPKSSGHCQAADQIIILEKKCVIFNLFSF